MADTGQGATLTLATTGSVGVVKSLTLPEFTIEKLETSGLATTGFKEYVPTDLAEPGEVTAEVFFDPTANSLESFGVNESVTVTWPIHTSGNTTNATLIGTGFITGQKFPDMASGELQMYTLTIAYDGVTGPAFTAESV